ncbi:MAG TPA: choice-of-anchor D domain-containing protein [Casimicrobiaceae bacterium]
MPVRRLALLLAAVSSLAWLPPALGAEAPDHVVLDADAPPGQREPKFLFSFDEPVRWPGTIVWKYNPAGAPAGFADTATTVARLTAALDKWSAVCAVSHSYQGTTATAPNNTPGGQPDLANVVGWAPLQGSTAGVTWTWYSTPGGVPRLIDGDIILSPTLVTANGPMDRVAVHEWGHLIGLAHSNMNQAVLSGPPYSSYNNLTTLTDDDVRGCRCLYGPAAGQSAGLLCSLPRELAFGNVPAGASSAPTNVTLTNGGNASLTLQAASFTSSGFNATGCAAGTTLGTGQSCVLSVSFAPTAQTAYAATMSIPVAGESQPYRIELSGTGTASSGPTPSLSPTSAAFGSQSVSTTSPPTTLVLSNAGSGAYSVTGFTPGGTHPGDFNRAGTCAVGTTLGAGASCTIALTFSPLAAGARNATLAVALSSGSVPVIALSGTGTAPATPPVLSVSTSTLGFADQLVGTQSASQSVSITNTGGGTLTLSSSAALGGAAAVEFSLGGNCTAGRVLSASQSCSASVRFAPASAGAKGATLVFATSAGNASVALAGNAIVPPPIVAGTVVEYYHAAYDHYFITIGADEIAALDTGVFGGWVRTGFTFKAHGSAQPGFASICRFYLPPGYGDTHFYSASPAECAIVHEQNPAFFLESTAVMYLATPHPVSGACPAGADPVYRVWNHRADTNHRYTASRNVRDAMVAQGYVAEGSGPDVVTFCAPR